MRLFNCTTAATSGHSLSLSHSGGLLLTGSSRAHNIALVGHDEIPVGGEQLFVAHHQVVRASREGGEVRCAPCGTTTVLGRGVLCFAPPVFFTWSLPASTFIDPLLWLLVAMAAGLYLARGSFTGHRGKRAFRVLLGAWLALWLLSTPLVTALLLWQLEPWPADISPTLEGASPERTALVVLSGGMRGPPWLPRFERMNGGSLPRAIGAADVYAAHPGRFGLVVVSGKAPGTPDTALAMADALALFGVPRDRIALEPDSETTRANAQNTARLLKERGIETTVLVTSALHMRRAAAEFERAGVHVIWAPVDNTVRPLGGLDTLFPDAASLSRLDEILHELVGRFKP